MQTTGKISLPSGKKLAVNLGFDFDAFSVWMESFGKTSPVYLSRGEFGAEVGVPRILKLLDKYKIKSSFCIPGHTADSFPEQCREIISQGHEIVHHGYVHEDPTFLPEEREKEILLKGFESLDKLGVRPIGYRSPGWDFSENTAKLLHENGIKYDSSLMGNDFYPYYPRPCKVHFDQGNVFGAPYPIVEMPVTWYLDDFPHSEFVEKRTGMKPPSQVYEIWKKYFDYGAENAENGMMNVTMHPQVIGRPHNMIMLEEFINYVLEHDGWIASMGTIYENITFK